MEFFIFDQTEKYYSVQVLACCTGDKPLSEPTVASFAYAYASFVFGELNWVWNIVMIFEYIFYALNFPSPKVISTYPQ